MTATTSLRDALTALDDCRGPGSPAVHTAMLIAASFAAHAASATDDHHEASRWDFCAITLHQAIDQLPSTPGPAVAIAVNDRTFANDNLAAIASGIRDLISRLILILTHAADTATPPTVRETWATTAARLRQAAGEVP